MERLLRKFIDEEMRRVFGADWAKYRPAVINRKMAEMFWLGKDAVGLIIEASRMLPPRVRLVSFPENGP